MNIGLLGGSFNPVHNAHLRIAGEAAHACALDRVIFIPAADPPHKRVAGNVAFSRRAAMVELAIAGNPGFELSVIEAERPGKSYSIDTITIFKGMFPDEELFFIIGGDSFMEIATWRSYEEIFRVCNLIVVERPGCPTGHKAVANLPESLRRAFRSSAAGTTFIHESGRKVTFVAGDPWNISSTEIRRLAATGNDITHLVPPGVAAYISQQRIYTQCP